MTFKELAKKVLQEEKRPLSAKEIWEIAKIKGYDKQCKTKGKTPERTIAAQIYVDIKNNPNSVFVKIESRPVRFSIRDKNDDTEKIEEDNYGLLSVYILNYHLIDEDGNPISYKRFIKKYKHVALGQSQAGLEIDFKVPADLAGWINFRGILDLESSVFYPFYRKLLKQQCTQEDFDKLRELMDAEPPEEDIFG